MQAAQSLASGIVSGLLAAGPHQRALAAAGSVCMHILQQAAAPLSQLACLPQQQQQQQHVPSAAQSQPLHLLQQHLQWQRQHRQYSSRAAAPSSKDLADVMKLQLLQDKSADDVEHIWMAVRRKSNSYFDHY
jgi:hypothetical protein